MLESDDMQTHSGSIFIKRQLISNIVPLIHTNHIPHTGIIDRAVTSAEELLTLLTSPKQGGSESQQGKQSKGIFLTTISFLPQGISFAPDTSAVLEELNGTVESIISITQQVNE